MNTKKKGTSLGVLTQKLGPTPHPVAYFSKQLDQTVKGWLPWLQAVPATCDLFQEAEKFILGQPTTVYVPHQTRTDRGLLVNNRADGKFLGRRAKHSECQT